MLVEINQVKQFEDEGYRRWFSDTYFDLIVWYEDDRTISGFQLCYDKENTERSLTWKNRSGFEHNKIDNGEKPGRAKMTPILVPDGLFSKDEIAERFKASSRNIDREVADFVYKKLTSYSP
ncbi:MAG: hypothetical protein JW881_09095 [Spirochaetales bacterium]|nr:hypothetical protein [Spirochaetales bacterium]